jgi:CHAT domain-containing protein/Tfp pilus assembly protein PilF
MPKQVSKVRTTSSPDFSRHRFQSAVNFLGGAALFNQIAPVSNPQGQGLPTTRCAAFIINLLIWVGLSFSPTLWPGSSLVQASAGARRAAQIAQETDSLESGKPIERELSGGQSHSYKITMISGQYLHVVVAQRGIDVAVALFAPDGKKISEVDSEHLVEGSETVSMIAEAPGAYLIEVRSPEKAAKTGHYEIKVEELRAATAEDKYRVAGVLAAQEAERLQNGNLEAKRKSIEKYHEALGLYRRASDRKVEADILNNIGAVYWSLGEMQKALEKYNEALPISRAVGDRRGEAITLGNIGLIYRLLGEMQKALEKYNEALPIKRAVGDRRGEAITLNNIGAVYNALGEPQKALEKYNEALSLRRAVGDRSGEATTLSNMGTVYRSLGEPQKALEKYNEALPINRAAGDRRGEAITLNNIGFLYQLLGEPQKALEKHNEALPLRRAVGDRSGEAFTLHNIGAVYDSLGEAQKALEKFNEALSLRRDVSDRNGEAATLLGIARVEQKRGNLNQARQLIEQAIGLIESLRTNIVSQELRASYFASRQEFFETYIDVLMQMRKQNPAEAFDAVALAVSERARARSLLELLKESRADIRQGVDSSLLERERSLQQRLNARAAEQARLLNRKHTPEQADAAAKEIAAITTEYEETEGQIRARSPRYADLTQPQPLGLTEIQQQALDEDTLLLEYALGEQRSYLWLVSHRSIDSYELPPRAEVEAATRRVYELLTARPKPWTPPDPQFIAQARTLSKMLLGPVASQLGGKRLVVVAPGALSYLPFAALPAPDDKERPAPVARRKADKKRQAGYYKSLIAEHEVVSIPSASVLSIIRREMEGRQRVAKSVAVLADPVFEEADPRLDEVKKGNSSGETPLVAPAVDAEHSELMRAIRTMNFPDARSGFVRLPFSRFEADGIIALAPRGTGRLKATDFSASRALAMSRELSQYRIVHFATHGLLNSARPELSGLVFSLLDREGKPQDGFLRLHEIYNLQLNADLVVLSACESGLGKEIKGEGLIGLTRGFMYAGAPRVVASLWTVDDYATAELMKLFYQRMLKDGLPAGAALRAAQLEFSGDKRWASPYFWAGFVLLGEWK